MINWDFNPRKLENDSFSGLRSDRDRPLGCIHFQRPCLSFLFIVPISRLRWSHLPELGSDLVATLASLDVNDFPHDFSLWSEIIFIGTRKLLWLVWFILKTPRAPRFKKSFSRPIAVSIFFPASASKIQSKFSIRVELSYHASHPRTKYFPKYRRDK